MEEIQEGVLTKEGEQYLYYKNNAIEAWNSNSTKRVKYISSGVRTWWLRSPYYGNGISICCINGNGEGNHYYYSYGTFGVAPGFCI